MESYHQFSQIYDELIREDIDYQKMADFIKSYIPKNSYYLDLGTGTGNLAVLISPIFKETYLVDLSTDMLTMASSKFQEKSIPHQAFAVSMIDINFPVKFDLITSSTDSINYLIQEDEVKNLFKKVYNHLKQNGVFIFDLNSPYKIKEILGNNDYIYNGEDLLYTWQNTLDGDVVEMDLNFFVRNQNYYERFEEMHYERSYELGEIRDWLKEANLELVSVHPGYEEGPILTNTERFVFIARKR